MCEVEWKLLLRGRGRVHFCAVRSPLQTMTVSPPQQAAALVNIYKDGSVLVTHGGAEMGQGVHTKMQQVRHLCQTFYSL